jgi:hypothetical protein
MEHGLLTDAGDAQDAAGESELEDARLAEFYAFTYEDAVLVGTTGSPRALRGKDSPLRRPPSPTRIHFHHNSAEGPSASHVAGATAVEEVPLISRETLDALIPPKSVATKRSTLPEHDGLTSCVIVFMWQNVARRKRQVAARRTGHGVDPH